MSTAPSIPASLSPPVWLRFLARAALMSLIWIALNGLDWGSWIVGGPMVLASTALSVWLLPVVPWHVSVVHAISFAAFFVVESIRGGWDVARHALAAPLRISPGLVRYRFHLPPGAARRFFCSIVSLLPGTATVATEADYLSAHALELTSETEEELRNLERRVAALFGVPWIEHEEGAP
ncbi:MAG: Na+/H+ antiporter subunit E [Verrucomicrobiia bacterium]